MTALTHFVLLQADMADAAGLAAAAQAWCADAGLPLTLHRAAWAASNGTAYVYGRLPAPEPLGAEALAPLVTHWQALHAVSSNVRASRLELALDAPGVSHAEAPQFHYVVETDPEDGWADEIYRWYDTEHMPGLASVPGCIHARRLLNHDHGPRSHACYDLTRAETLGSPPWLSVRGTLWSDICRPHFTHTLRTMMEVLE